MKTKFFPLLGAFLLASFTAPCQQDASLADPAPAGIAAKTKHLNLFVISKRKKGKFDPATRFNVLRAKLRSFFRPRRFAAIVATDMQQASAKILYRLQKHQAQIGTLWFDSHGMYKKGYSLFQVGHDEVSHKSLRDSALRSCFLSLSAYTDDQTQFVIGSCYGGATYERSSIDYKDTTRMNGDSLMMAIGSLLRHGIVYGSESWVMTKPGLFKRKPAVGGFPGRKLFRDVCYRPAWENVGRWNQYNVSDGCFGPVNPVALDPNGNLVVRGKPFREEKKVDADIRKSLASLQPWLYH